MNLYEWQKECLEKIRDKNAIVCKRQLVRAKQR